MSDQVRILARDDGTGRRRLPVATTGAALLALLVGLLLGRSSAPDSQTAQRPGVTRGAAGQASRRVGAVLLGYPHTRSGAVAATFNGGAALGDPRVLLNTTQRTRVLKLIATDRYMRTFTGSGAAALDQARNAPLGRGLADGAQTISLTSPLAYRVTSYTADTARVMSWGVAVVGNAEGLAPSASWAIARVTLRWEHGDWKIDAASSADGPTPGLAGQRPTDADGFISGLAGTQGVHHAP